MTASFCRGRSLQGGRRGRHQSPRVKGGEGRWYRRRGCGRVQGRRRCSIQPAEACRSGSRDRQRGHGKQSRRAAREEGTAGRDSSIQSIGGRVQGGGSRVGAGCLGQAWVAAPAPRQHSVLFCAIRRMRLLYSRRFVVNSCRWAAQRDAGVRLSRLGDAATGTPAVAALSLLREPAQASACRQCCTTRHSVSPAQASACRQCCTGYTARTCAASGLAGLAQLGSVSSDCRATRRGGVAAGSASGGATCPHPLQHTASRSASSQHVPPAAVTCCSTAQRSAARLDGSEDGADVVAGRPVVLDDV